MTDIYYETEMGENTYRIDDVSQRLIVYLLINGDTHPNEAVDPIGVKNVSEIHTRINEQLGPEAAGFVEEFKYAQKTFAGGEKVRHYQLTKRGESFVYDHKSSLAMPADLAELAKKVAELRVEQDELRNLQDEVYDLEERLTVLEDQFQT